MIYENAPIVFVNVVICIGSCMRQLFEYNGLNLKISSIQQPVVITVSFFADLCSRGILFQYFN